MPIQTACDACGSRLKVADNLVGRKIRCPKCGDIMLVAETSAPAAPPVRQAVTARPPLRKKPKAPLPPEPEEDEAPAEEEPPRKKKSRPLPPPEPDGSDEDEAPADEDRPRRKKKKRRRSKQRQESTTPAWVGWVTGGGIAFVVLVTLSLLLFVAWRQPDVIFLAVVFGVMLVVSTVIMVLSMFISSAIAGGMDFGEPHIIIPKGMALLVVVNLISLLPFGWLMALPVWVLGCMAVFRLDLWEARLLVAVNWTLNFLARFAVVMVVLSILSHAGGGGPGGGFGGGGGGPRRAFSGSQENAAKAIEALGGDCEPDENNEKEVGTVSLGGTRATDADLAQLKSFPRLRVLVLDQTAITDAGLAHLEGLKELRTLDLSNTQITDAGLAHLKGLTKLEELDVANTRVTDAGVRNLQQSLPRTRIIRQPQ